MENIGAVHTDDYTLLILESKIRLKIASGEADGISVKYCQLPRQFLAWKQDIVDNINQDIVMFINNVLIINNVLAVMFGKIVSNLYCNKWHSAKGKIFFKLCGI